MQNSITRLPDEITRELVFIKGRSGLLYEPFNPGLVANQARFDKPESNLEAMFQVHARNASADKRILGIREMVKECFDIIFDGQSRTVVSKDPQTKTTWFGSGVRIISPEEAAQIPYAGRTALNWAKDLILIGTPEMVVKANNGFFYPASRKDIAVDLK